MLISIIYFNTMVWVAMTCFVSSFSQSSRLKTAVTDSSVIASHQCHHRINGRSPFVSLSPLSMNSDSSSDSFKSRSTSNKEIPARRTRARDLIHSLVQEEQCFTTESGAVAFVNACAINVLYEDCYEPQPLVGRTVRHS